MQAKFSQKTQRSYLKQGENKKGYTINSPELGPQLSFF